MWIWVLRSAGTTKTKELNRDPWVMDVRMRSEVLLFFVCRGSVACNFSPLLAVLVLQLHHGLFLACQDSADFQDVMLSIFELRSNSEDEAGLDFG